MTTKLRICEYVIELTYTTYNGKIIRTFLHDGGEGVLICATYAEAYERGQKHCTKQSSRVNFRIMELMEK